MSRSDLPRLKGSTGQSYQMVNLSPARNPAIETQRMRTAILGQIQSVQSEEERQVQEIEAQLSLISRELSPKMQNIDRHNAFNQQQLDELLAKINQIQNVAIPRLSTTNDDLQKKFEKSIRAKTQTRLRPLAEEIDLEKSRLDQLSDTIVSGLESASDQLKKLAKEQDETSKNALEIHGKIKARLETLRPKIAAMEKQLASYAAATDVSFIGPASGDTMERAARKLRTDIAHLETDELPEAVQSSASETLASITSVTNDIEQKFTAAKAALANVENAVKTTRQQQLAADSQLREVSDTSSMIEKQMEDETVELNRRLEELEKTLDKLSREMYATLEDLNEEREGNSGWTVQGLADDIESLRTIASNKLNQLKEDWFRFHGDNRAVQEMVDDNIDEFVRILNGKLNLIKRVQAAEQRAKWCVERLNAWQKEEERKKALEVSDEVLWEKLHMLEEKLYETEERLRVQDGLEAPPLVILPELTDYEGPTPPPPGINRVEALDPVVIPEGLKLAYDEESTAITLEEPVVVDGARPSSEPEKSREVARGMVRSASDPEQHGNDTAIGL